MQVQTTLVSGNSISKGQYLGGGGAGIEKASVYWIE